MKFLLPQDMDVCLEKYLRHHAHILKQRVPLGRVYLHLGHVFILEPNQNLHSGQRLSDQFVVLVKFYPQQVTVSILLQPQLSHREGLVVPDKYSVQAEFVNILQCPHSDLQPLAIHTLNPQFLSRHLVPLVLN